MKKILIGDIHFGERSNSEEFNSQILEMLEFACEYAEKNNIEECVQFGDYYHHRHQLNVSTLNYGILGAKILNKQFGKDKLWVLAGNHCIYHKDRLDVSSLEAISPYVTVVDQPTSIGNVYMTPWIIDDVMWDQVVNAGKKHDYLFAHLELNGFKMNDAYVMEHGASHKELRDYDMVFTGHYHSIQEKDNILYLGTPYPITMNEANEPHGFWVFDDETGDVEFVEYDGIKVVSINYTDIEDVEDYDPRHTTVRVEFPDDLDDESLIDEVSEYLREKNFFEVKTKFTGNKVKELMEADVGEVEEVENIDLVVKTFIGSSYEVEGVDKSTLLKYYDRAIEMGEEK